MATGDQVRALKIVSRQRGWDPDVIKGGGSIAPFDVSPNPTGDNSGVGKIPGGPPAASGKVDPSQESALDQYLSFNAPDATRETKNRATKNANPFPGGITG